MFPAQQECTGLAVNDLFCRYVKATRVVVRCRRGIYERRALPLQDAAADVDDAAVQVWSPVVLVNPRRPVQELLGHC